MRIYLNFSFLVLFVFSNFNSLSAQQKKKIPFYELDVIRGLFFQPNTIAPYSGTGIEDFADGRKKMQVPIKDGKINGSVKEWAVNGQKTFEAAYEMGVQTGLETQWFANGQKSLEIPYTSGQANGSCKEWYKNGEKKSEGLFRNGKEEGEHLWWYSSGQLDQQVNYINGKAEGLVKNWYETGQLKLQSEYKAGKKEGELTRWYANGQKHSVGYYSEGVENGKESTWSKSGLLEGVKVFEKGELKKEFNYRSGSIYLGKGYLQVINERESFFTIEVKGANVSPRWTNGVSSYSVDGNLLQVFNYPISNFVEAGNSVEKESAMLELFQKNEYEIHKEKYGAELEVLSKLDKNAKGKEYLYWSFPVPSNFKQREGAKKIMEEHYLSVICNKQVVNLRSVSMEGESKEEIQQMLKKTVETLVVEDERIDLNSVLKK